LAGKDLEAEVAHGSQLRLIGEIESLKITANTGAQVACEGLKAIKVLAKANTGAQIDLGAGADFKLVANTGGIITYPGEPEKLDVKTSLGGEITSVQ
ncbi:MAG: GIN domain-containing protein, partial [Luteibaculum sp.]